MGEGNAKRASVAWSSLSTSSSSGGDASTCEKAKEKEGGDEDDGREDRGQMSSSLRGASGTPGVAVGGRDGEWSVQDQPVVNGVCDVVIVVVGDAAAGASHSDSAW